MTTGSEVFGSCVEEIDVSVELKNGDGWLCGGWKYSKLTLAGKASQSWCCRVLMVPGIGGHLWRSGGDLSNKKPLRLQGLGMIREVW